MKQTAEAPTLKPVFIFALVLFLSITSRMIFAPLLLDVEHDLGLTHAQASSLFLFIAIGYSSGMFLSSFVSSIVSHRATIIGSLFVLAGMTFLVSTAETLPGIQLGTLAIGIAAGFYFPSSMATITELAGPERIGRAIAIHEFGPNLAFIFSPLITLLTLRFTDWRGTMIIVGIAIIAIAIVYALTIPWGAFRGERMAVSSMRPLLREKDFWVTILLFGVIIGGSQGVYSLLPAYLVGDRGMNPGLVNSVIGISRVSGLFAVLLSGWMVDRFGIRKTVGIIVSFSSVLTIMLGLGGGWFLVGVILLQPALLAAFFPAGLSAATRIGPPHSRSLTMSLVVPFGYFIGVGIVPMFLGICADYGRLPWGFAGLGAAMVSTLFVFFFFNIFGGQSTRLS